MQQLIHLAAYIQSALLAYLSMSFLDVQALEMRPLERFFYAYGDFLARHPWPFVIVPALLTIISSYGMLSFHSQDDIWDMYAPLDGLARLEEQALKPFEYASGSHHYRMQILVTRKDGGNILTMDGLDEIYEVQKYISENVTASDGIQELHYSDMCGVYCDDSNAAVIAVLQTAISSDDDGLSSVRLTYPNAEAFQVDTTLPNGKKIAANYEQKLLRVFATLTESSANFAYSMLSRNREIAEQRAITIVALPFLGLTALVLIGFMFITLIEFPLYRSQFMESVIGMISPAMALWTSGGFLFWIGFPFSNILTVVPFLVERRFFGTTNGRINLNFRRFCDRDLCHRCLLLPFAIGLFANHACGSGCSACVQLYVATVVMDCCLQLTFFSAMMSFIVRRQINHDEKARDRKIQDGNPSITSIDDHMKAKLGETDGVFDLMLPSFTSPVREIKPKKSRLEVFVDFLQTKTAKALVMFIFFAHVGVSTYLATEVSTDFNMENLYLEGSPLTEISRQMQDFVLQRILRAWSFAVRPMPDFSDENIRERFNEMVEKLETLPKYGWGPEATVFWLRDYNRTIQFWEEEEDFWSPEILLRDLLASYPSFHVLSHHPFEKVPKNFLQTAVSAVILMSILVLLFVMNWEAIISVVVSIVSICLGIVAYLHLWGVCLDAVSLISILMSVGFSVDYSAHVCYHYFAHAAEDDHHKDEADSVESGSSGSSQSINKPLRKSAKDRSSKRLLATFHGVGWPVVQSGLSTII
ncbi:patched family protein, partial [Ostertagia ostertagi]